MNIRQIHPSIINQVWHVVAGYLADGLRHSGGEYDLSQVRMMLTRGEQSLLVMMNGEEVVGAASISIENFPNARIAFIATMGGRWVLNEAGFSQLAGWASEQGCTAVRGGVRESVARLSEKSGFERKYIVVERKL